MYIYNDIGTLHLCLCGSEFYLSRMKIDSSSRVDLRELINLSVGYK